MADKVKGANERGKKVHGGKNVLNFTKYCTLFKRPTSNKPMAVADQAPRIALLTAATGYLFGR